MVTLATCGCQLPSFRCTICKKKYTSYYLPPSAAAYLTYLPHYYLLPVTYYRPTYYYYTCIECTEERSTWCPKLVSNPEGYICGPCKITSIDKLCTLSEADSCLQVLLELNLFPKKMNNLLT